MIEICYFVLVILLLARKRTWHCDLLNSYLHACWGCWTHRFLFTILVIVPAASNLWRLLR